jgi:hypothetical protein
MLIALKLGLTGSRTTAQFAGLTSINRFDFNVGEGSSDTSWWPKWSPST